MNRAWGVWGSAPPHSSTRRPATEQCTPDTAPAPTPNHQLSHAGTRRDSSGELLTAGGRVLAVVAQGDDFDAAFAGAYNGLNQLDYAGITYRRDIGHQVRSGG